MGCRRQGITGTDCNTVHRLRERYPPVAPQTSAQQWLRSLLRVLDRCRPLPVSGRHLPGYIVACIKPYQNKLTQKAANAPPTNAPTPKHTGAPGPQASPAVTIPPPILAPVTAASWAAAFRKMNPSQFSRFSSIASSLDHFLAELFVILEGKLLQNDLR